MIVACERPVVGCATMAKRSGGGDWDAIKKAFEADALARQQDAARLSPADRVLFGLRMELAAARTSATDKELERIASEQALLHARWRWLEARRGGER
jgi:hypothetical protein